MSLRDLFLQRYRAQSRYHVKIATSVVEFQAQKIGPESFTSRHYRRYQQQDEHYETEIVLNSNLMIPDIPHIIKIRLQSQDATKKN